ncbi:NAD-dependent epimerase/dehydratase family protein [Bifidobacterium scardovii]|uniref:NAD-dependent epimerase/dehydratase family protein n=1 Tax=Bifidobacterium scardovii TaxID=158787 RepID=UPI000529C488|nr:NAD(P)-dependent oxidoreductase [Bifidobacterium scardovii]MDK6348368.1 NAD(P)-dependent oxidoreductase [Bifidobacterium scardovii]MDU8982871.1 NAD(P)-dependent oxidoreductase [Bifidobacterium scardovii]BAQ32466.1 putative NAD-dependent epimerase/dehydratase [Bifidobacterium scardovii JCM 12489 = DSM 13734]
MAKRILVTGAGGYIGRHVVEALLDAGHEVIASDIRLKDVDPRARKVEANLFAPSEGLFERLGSPDVCLHMAWRDGFKHNSDAHMGDLSGHYHFIKTMLDEGLRQIAVMGSMHEVGYWEGAIDENTPCHPASMYGIAKNALRESTLLLAQQHEATAQWIRAYYIVGDDARGNSIFSKLLAAAQEGKKTFPFTTGKNKYDFINVDVLAKQIAAVVSQDEVNGIINCCTGQPMSLAERVEQYIAENHLDITLDYGAFPDRPYDSPAVWGDNTKIQSIMKSAECS